MQHFAVSLSAGLLHPPAVVPIHLPHWQSLIFALKSKGMETLASFFNMPLQSRNFARHITLQSTGVELEPQLKLKLKLNSLIKHTPTQQHSH